MSTVERPDAAALIAERAATHGDWPVTAAIAIRLKGVVFDEWRARIARGQSAPSAGQREALDQICTKMARILAGDPGFVDHWRDVNRGYLPLAAVAGPRSTAGPVPNGGAAAHAAAARGHPSLLGLDRFTGDICDECGSLRMVRTGTCVTCLDCGTTGGCG